MKTLVLLFLLAEVVIADILFDYYQSNLLFTEDIYKRAFHSSKGNLFVSPASIQAVLAIVALGGQSETQTELMKVAHLPVDPLEVTRTYIKLDEKLSVPKSSTFSHFDIYTHNATLISPYAPFVQAVFKAVIIKKPVSMYRTSSINSFIILSNGITFQHQLFLNATLKTKFCNAHPSNFHMKNDSVKVINMLHAKQEFNYYHNEVLHAEFLQMPFTDREITFTIVLPDKADLLYRVTKYTHEFLLDQPYQKVNISVTIPKVWHTYADKLTSSVKSIDANRPFSDAARFSGISHSPSKITEVSHVASFDFFQEISEAELPSESSNPSELKFVANRPFMYYVKHRILGVIAIGDYERP